MELQFKTTSCNCLSRAAQDISVQELTQEVRLDDGMPDVGRVLSSWGQMILRSKEWRGDTVTLTGGVMVWVLYAPEDGGEPRCVDSWIPYQLRWEHLDSDREGPVRINPILRFVDARTVAARKIMVRAGAAAMAEALYPSQFQLYSPEELPEDVEVLRRTYPMRLPKEAGEKTFHLDEDLTIAGSAADRVISYTLCPEITDRRVLSNKVVFRGNGNLHLIYCCDEGRILTQDFALPFSQYADLEEAYSPDAQADIWMGITNLELDLDDQGQLRLKCGMVAQYLVDDRELIELIEDAYSPRRSVEPRMQSLVLPAILEDREERITIDQQLNGHSGEAVDVAFLPDIPVQRRTSEGIKLELPGQFQVLYYGDDGTLQSGSVRRENEVALPAGEGSEIRAILLPIIPIKVQQSAEGLTLKGEMLLRLRTTADSGMPMVTGLETGELQEPDAERPSLILCRSGGEELWKIAKRCGSTVESIRAANGLQEEPDRESILLIPVS